MFLQSALHAGSADLNVFIPHFTETVLTIHHDPLHAKSPLLRPAIKSSHHVLLCLWLLVMRLLQGPSPRPVRVLCICCLRITIIDVCARVCLILLHCRSLADSALSVVYLFFVLGGRVCNIKVHSCDICFSSGYKLIMLLFQWHYLYCWLMYTKAMWNFGHAVVDLKRLCTGVPHHSCKTCKKAGMLVSALVQKARIFSPLQ